MHFTFRELLATVAFVLGAMALTHAVPSQANTYIFTEEGCSGDCGVGPFGTLTVTEGAANQLNFSLVVSAGYTLRGTKDNQHHALAFNLIGNPTLLITGLPSALTSTGLPGLNNASPYGRFDYAINYPKPSPQNPTPALTSFTFTAQANGLSLASLEPNSSGMWFVTDVISPSGATGSVAAVPEPSEWAMLLVGVAFVGFIARRRRSMS